MSGSSNLDSFRDGLVGGPTTVFLWVVASGTGSILLAAFFCNCHQVFSPVVLLASM